MSMLDDIATYMQTAGIGTLGVDFFKGYTPDALDNIVGVYNTGGLKPSPYIPTRMPTLQVFIRAESYTLGAAKLELVRSTLHQLANKQVGSTYFYYILAQSEGGHIGRNERGLDEFSINFVCLTR